MTFSEGKSAPHPSGEALSHREFISKTTLKQLLPEKIALVDADVECSLESAAKIMCEKKIHSIPIFQSTPRRKYYLGVLSTADILCGVSQQFHDEEIEEFHLSHLVTSREKLWIHQDFNQLDVVLRSLAGGEQAVLVQRYQDFLPTDLGIVTQTDLVRFLYRNIDKLDPSLLNTKLGDTALGQQSHYDESFTVKRAKSAGAAFHQMHFYHHESLAVVNNNCTLLANISASDLRGLSKEQILALDDINVIDFLTDKPGESTKSGELRKIITATPDQTFGHVLKTMSKEKIAQMWVVDDKNFLISQVTRAEILLKFIAHPYDVRELLA